MKNGFVCLYLWTTYFFYKVDGIKMVTRGDTFDRNAADSLTLHCDFRADYFNLFDNPILWLKSQLHEETQINIQGNLNAPFVNEGRFNVVFKPHPPKYEFELQITNLSVEDNGNYTCEIRGRGSSLLGNVTHKVVVRSPVERIYLSDRNDTIDTSIDSPISTVMYTETQLGTLRCLTFGGYPAPSITIYVGKRDISQQLSWAYTSVFEGKTGLRNMAFDVERWTFQYEAQADDDGKHLRCVAQVPGLTPTTEKVRLRVNYLPRINCLSGQAIMGERNVSITCTVTSRPIAKDVWWYIETDGNKFDVEMSTAYWVTKKIVDSTHIQTTLFISHAGPQRFRTYTVLAKNSVGEGMQVVDLKQIYTTTPPEILSEKALVEVTTKSGYPYYFIYSQASVNSFTKVLYFIILLNVYFSICNFL